MADSFRPLKIGEFRVTPAGQKQTEFTLTVADPRLNGGQPTLIPSIWKVNGKIIELSQDRAIELAHLFQQKRRVKFPVFKDFAKADLFAQKRSSQGGVFGGPLFRGLGNR